MEKLSKAFVLVLYFIISTTHAFAQTDGLASLLPGLIQTQNDLAKTVGASTAGIQALDEKVDARFKQVDERFNKVDERFNKVDERFNKVDDQFSELRAEMKSQASELRAEMKSQADHIITAMNLQFEARDAKLYNHINTLIESFNNTLKNHADTLSNHTTLLSDHAVDIHSLQEQWTKGLQGRIFNWGTFATLSLVAGTLKAATIWSIPDPLQQTLIIANGVALGAISWHIIGPAFGQSISLSAQAFNTFSNMLACYHLMQHKVAIVDWMTNHYKTSVSIIALISAAAGDWEKYAGKLWGYLPTHVQAWFAPSSDQIAS